MSTTIRMYLVTYGSPHHEAHEALVIDVTETLEDKPLFIRGGGGENFLITR